MRPHIQYSKLPWSEVIFATKSMIIILNLWYNYLATYLPIISAWTCMYLTCQLHWYLHVCASLICDTIDLHLFLCTRIILLTCTSIHLASAWFTWVIDYNINSCTIDTMEHNMWSATFHLFMIPWWGNILYSNLYF